MLVRETTHEASTLSIDHGMVGRSLPMLRTAAGRCYLAFCPAKERRAIVEMLSRSKAPEDRWAREPQRLTRLLDAIEAKGYAIQDREINPKTTGIAVPIRLGPRLLGKYVIDLDIVGDDHRKSRSRTLPAAGRNGCPHCRRDPEPCTGPGKFLD